MRETRDREDGGTSSRPQSKLGAVEHWDSRFLAAQGECALPLHSPMQDRENAMLAYVLPECKTPEQMLVVKHRTTSLLLPRGTLLHTLLFYFP